MFWHSKNFCFLTNDHWFLIKRFQFYTISHFLLWNLYNIFEDWAGNFLKNSRIWDFGIENFLRSDSKLTASHPGKDLYRWYKTWILQEKEKENSDLFYYFIRMIDFKFCFSLKFSSGLPNREQKKNRKFSWSGQGRKSLTKPSSCADFRILSVQRKIFRDQSYQIGFS